MKRIEDFRNMLSKRVDTLYRESKLQAEMGNYDKSFVLKIKADEANLILVDLNGYLNETD